MQRWASLLLPALKFDQGVVTAALVGVAGDMGMFTRPIAIAATTAVDAT